MNLLAQTGVPYSPRRNRRVVVELLRTAALALLLIGIWFAVYRRVPGKDWAPVAYGGGDEAFIYATVKAVKDGEIGLFGTKQVSRLGAPFAANWNDFPSTEDFLYFVTGQAARVMGVIAAVDTAYLVAIIAAATAFYLVGRYMRWRWELCFAAAILYGWSYYMTHRSVPHFNLVFYWPCPFWLLLCWWTASRRGIVLGGRRFWFGAAVMLLTAWNNPYYAAIALQLLTLAMVAHLIRGYPGRALAGALCLTLLCVGSALLMLLDTIFYQAAAGLNLGAVVRHLSDIERYALRPIDLFLPYSHPIAAVQSFVRWYGSNALLNGELSKTYLGVVGCLALISLWVNACYQLLRGSRGARVSGLALQSAWVVAYGICGGLSVLPALFGFHLLRANNRTSIVLLTLALFYAVGRGTQMTRKWSQTQLILLAMGIVALGIWDQTPVYNAIEVEAIRSRMKTDRLFVQRLEADLPKGAMIFQLPVVRSQESEPIYRMPPYDEFRPYLFSNSMRLSHGDDYGRAKQEWRAAVGRMPMANMVAQLEAHGFSGILIDRDAYQDGAKRLIEGIRQYGRESEWNRAHPTFVFVRLRPLAPPRTPLLPPLFAAGWYEQESDNTDFWHWSAGDAEIELSRPSAEVRQTDLTFDLQTATARTIEIMSDGEVRKRVTIARPLTDERVTVSVPWHDGERKLSVSFKSSAPPVSISTSDKRRFGVRVSNLEQTPPVFPD